MMLVRFFWVLVASAVLLVGFQQQAIAQEAVTEAVIEAPSPNDLRELMRLLADEKVQNWLREGVISNVGETETTQGASVRDYVLDGLNDVRSRIGALGRAWVLLPQTPSMLSDRWQEEMTLNRKIRSLTFLVVFLFVGAGLEWLYRQYTTIPLLRLTLLTHAEPGKRAMASLARLAIVGVGLLLFALGSIGTFLSFGWPPMVETVIMNFLLALIIMRVMRALSIFILAPKTPSLRLVPIPNDIVKNIHLLFMQAVRVVVYSIATADVFFRLTVDSGENSTSAALSVSVVAALIVAVTFAFVNFRGFQLWRRIQATGAPVGRMNWQLYVYVLIAVTFILWLIGVGPLMWSVLVIGALFPVMRILKNWVDYFFDEACAAVMSATRQNTEDESNDLLEAEEGGPESEDAREETAPALYSTWRLMAQRGLRFLVIFIAVLVLIEVWDTSFRSLSDSNSILGQVISVLIDAVFVFLVADLIWAWAKTTIDRRLDAYVPPEDGQAPGPEARMATLLPLLRITLLVALVIMVIFSVLSSLGVNIAPLIAGAGVLGIAIGFGAQSLVRDVVSGVFFLIDDAFRLGEYIEIGELRGTVEGISIRSLRVRHHRGAIHTIPFGELKSLTNHSRDWVIMKLEFRVQFDTDLQLVKKLVKKVGAELLANEFYGKSILSTLKSQGVRRMEEFNMVIGVKFMTKPGEQWLVRRDAYQKVRDAFEANGIRMAERNVKVEIADADNLTTAQKLAVAGAAQQASEGPKLPPGPVPDEP